jgi:hypothetical protein
MLVVGDSSESGQAHMRRAHNSPLRERNKRRIALVESEAKKYFFVERQHHESVEKWHEQACEENRSQEVSEGIRSKERAWLLRDMNDSKDEKPHTSEDGQGG